MNKRVTTIVIAAVMALTCFAPVTGTAFAATDTKANTNKNGTYSGAFPTLPNAIGEQALKCASPYGTATSKIKYPKNIDASLFNKYRTALQTAYGDRDGWGKQTKAGASCDVFVGTVVRSSGYDNEYPRGLDEQYDYDFSKFTKLKIKDASEFKHGDIILYKKKGGAAHTRIYVEFAGKGYFAEAQYVHKYLPTLNEAFDQTGYTYSYYAVYRAKNRCVTALTRGGGGSKQIKKLQAFLNWAGFDCGEPDGAFGPKTEEAVIKFQKAAGIEADGKFGSESIKAAKSYVPGKKVKNTKKNDSTAKNSNNNKNNNNKKNSDTAGKSGKAYTGKFPTSVVNTKKGSKTDIKRWQRFLKWYGYDVEVDGDFGKITKKYTAKFQKKNNLEADGSAGPKTIKKAKSIRK